jgi:membrane protease subunit HflC
VKFLKTPAFAVALLLLLIALFPLLRSIFYVVDERHLAVILQFGKPVRSIEEPGLYAKYPFIQEVRRFPRTLQVWTSSEDIVDLPTADGKKVEVAAWAIWKIRDPLKFVQALRTVSNGQLAVKDRVRAAIRDEITSYDLAEVVRSTDRELTYSFRFELPEFEGSETLDAPQPTTEQSSAEADGATAAAPSVAPQPAQPGAEQSIQYGRQEIVRMITDSVRARLEGREEGEIDRGITLVDVGLSNIGFVPTVREAAFERLRAFMDSIASGYTSSGEQRKQEIINRTQAEVEEILGKGEQEARIIRGEAEAAIIKDFAAAIEETDDLYKFLKTLELYESSLTDGTDIIMTTENDLLKLLQSIDADQADSDPAASQ